ncbi:hypothetical protein LP420_07700 [Massilia sp. B-10]|nr:hypothetical protein LP420_07700 [Massilia sp. B-10]
MAKDAPVEGVRAAAATTSDESAVRNRVLNEVLDAFSDLDDSAKHRGRSQGHSGLEEKAEGAG